LTYLKPKEVDSNTAPLLDIWLMRQLSWLFQCHMPLFGGVTQANFGPYM